MSFSLPGILRRRSSSFMAHSVCLTVHIHNCITIFLFIANCSASTRLHIYSFLGWFGDKPRPKLTLSLVSATSLLPLCVLLISHWVRNMRNHLSLRKNELLQKYFFCFYFSTLFAITTSCHLSKCQLCDHARCQHYKLRDREEFESPLLEVWWLKWY